MVLLVAGLGSVTAFAASLTARGSKFWQENWEGHVDLLEQPVEGKLHQIALVDRTKGISFSVSRLNERLLEILTVSWLAAFVAAVVAILHPELLRFRQGEEKWLQIIPVTIATIAAFTMLY